MAAVRRQGSFQGCQRRDPGNHDAEHRGALESLISLLGEFSQARNAYYNGNEQMWDCICPLIYPKDTFANGVNMDFRNYFNVNVRRGRSRYGEVKWTCVVEFIFRRQPIIHITLIYNPPGTRDQHLSHGVHFTCDVTGAKTSLQPDAIRDDEYESTYILGDQIGDICFDMARYYTEGVDRAGNPIYSQDLENFLWLPEHNSASQEEVRSHIEDGLMIFGTVVKAIVLYDRFKNSGGTTKREVFDETDRLREEINLEQLSGEDREDFMDDGYRGTDNWMEYGGRGHQKKLIVYLRKIQKIKELTKILNKNKSKNKIKIQKHNKQIKELKEKIKNTKEKLKKQKLKKEKLKKEKLKKEKLKKEKLEK